MTFRGATPSVGPRLRVDNHQCAGLPRVEVPQGSADDTAVGQLRGLEEDLDRFLDRSLGAEELLRVTYRPASSRIEGSRPWSRDARSGTKAPGHPAGRSG